MGDFIVTPYLDNYTLRGFSNARRCKFIELLIEHDKTKKSAQIFELIFLFEIYARPNSFSFSSEGTPSSDQPLIE